MGKLNEIQLLETSLQACIRSALAARHRLSTARERQGLRDPLAFLTRDEVNELRAEHQEVVAAMITAMHPSPKLARMAELAMTTKKLAATANTAAQIVRAGAVRRGEAAANDAPKAGSAAAQIVVAGKKRRGDGGGNGSGPTLAQQIILAGKKRRGKTT